MGKKDNFRAIWDISDSPVIENVGKYHFRRFLSQGSPKYPKIAQKWYCPKKDIARTMVWAQVISCAHMRLLAMSCLKILTLAF